MKIELVAVNSKFIHSCPAVHILKACCGENAKYVHISEYTINQYQEEILSDLFKKEPDVIAFSCYIWNYNMITGLLCDIKKILPDADILLGGPQVSYNAEQILREYPMVKGIFVGEGEESFSKVIEKYLGKDTDFSGIPGFFSSENQKVTFPEPSDIDKIPFFYDDLSEFSNRILYYESSRGCPFSCAYCLSCVDKKLRFRSLEKVKKELDFFLKNKVNQVKFIDRTFNANKSHARAIWQHILDNDNGVTNFHFEIAADILTKEDIDLLSKMRPGLLQLEIGVQSTNEAALKAVNRVTDMERLKSNVKCLTDAGNCHIHLDLIAGLPFEDYESFKKSFDEVYSMKPNQLQLGFLKLLMGTPLIEKADEYGMKYKKYPNYEIFSNKWISYAEILKLKKVEEVLEIFFNSGQFTNTIKELQKEYQSPYEMYHEIADFFEKEGFNSGKSARSYRYEMLLKFIEKKVPKKDVLFRELLTHDMYLREKCKSRPSFSRKDTEKTDKRADKHTEKYTYSVFSEEKRLSDIGEFAVEYDYSHKNPIDGNAKWRSFEVE